MKTFKLNFTMITGCQSDAHSTMVAYEYTTTEEIKNFNEYYEKTLRRFPKIFDIRSKFYEAYRQYAPSRKDKALDPDELEELYLFKINELSELKVYYEMRDIPEFADEIEDIKKDFIYELNPELFADIYMFIASLSIPNFSYWKVTKEQLPQELVFNARV